MTEKMKIPPPVAISPRPATTSPHVKVAYILLWFPEPSQTFILDEVNTLVNLGLAVQVYTLYGPRPPARLAGMAHAAAPITHLGLASLNHLAGSLLASKGGVRSDTYHLLRQVLFRRWRSLETTGEAWWAACAGVYLGGVFLREGITHIHAPWANGPATAAWVASRVAGLPFSFCAHAHDLYPPDGALQEKLAAAAFVRTISQRNLDFLIQVAPHTVGKLVKISYGAPLCSTSVSPRQPHPPYHLLALGRFVPKKGFSVLLEACRLLADEDLDFRLTLAGDGPQRHQLQQLAANLKLKDRVAFPGFVPHRQVPELFRWADLFVMPCIIDRSGDRDGLPNVILEAMALGVPVVATDVNGIPEAVRNGDTGWLVNQNDPPALARAVREALANPLEARRRALAGRELVEAEFNSQKNYACLKYYLEKFS